MLMATISSSSAPPRGQDDDLSHLQHLQLCPTIIEAPAVELCALLRSLETRVDHRQRCEWRSTVFANAHDQSALKRFRCAADLAPHFNKVRCRGNDVVEDGDDARVRRLAAEVVCTAWELLEERLHAVLKNAERSTTLRGRVRVGADFTVRRTARAQHGSPASYEKHNPSAPHSDSFDGTVLGFALVSTKLGTPVYPRAKFPCPLDMFLSQSRTGRNDAHQLDSTTLGPLRAWKPNTLVVMPACTAHSKPSTQQIESDTTPEEPRWFCRATLRVAVAGGFQRGRTEAARRDRLALSMLVAEHVWGDADFVAGARALSVVPYEKWGWNSVGKGKGDVSEEVTPMTRAERKAQVAANSGFYEGETNAEGVRHGRGKCTYANGDAYDGEWCLGRFHGIGVYEWTTSGRRYEGEWKDGNKDGEGTYVFHNGRRYTGMFAKNVPVDQAALDAARDGRHRKN